MKIISFLVLLLFRLIEYWLLYERVIISDYDDYFEGLRLWYGSLSSIFFGMCFIRRNVIIVWKFDWFMLIRLLYMIVF